MSRTQIDLSNGMQPTNAVQPHRDNLLVHLRNGQLVPDPADEAWGDFVLGVQTRAVATVLASLARVAAGEKGGRVVATLKKHSPSAASLIAAG